MNRIQPIAAHVAYMTCPGNHGVLSTVDSGSGLFIFTLSCLLQRFLISLATTSTGSQCLLVTTHSGFHGIWAQYISLGNYNYVN